jgi:hypothetical protein
MRRILILHYTPHPRAVRLTTEQHLDAVTNLPGSDVLSYNAVNGAPAWLRRLTFDAVILHTTLLCMRWNPWFLQWKRRLDWLADVGALKIALPQDEYDHAHSLDEWLDDLGVSVVCTVLDDRHRTELYPRLRAKAAFPEILTGYIDEPSAERFRARMVPAAGRPHDVVYRARHLPYWYGSHGQLKHRIGNAVLERASAHGLDCDISTRGPETILGDAWLDFLGSGRATIGSESGVSVLDRHGEVRDEIRELLREDPSLTFEEVGALMPSGWDDYRFFAVSPRHLEAVVTKTAQLLVEGRYSGVLEPERHYIPVRRDFTNLEEALERARDRALLERLADQAYEDVYLSGRFGVDRLTETMDRVLTDAGLPPRRGAAPRSPSFALAKGVATAQSDTERLLVAPVANVLRVGRVGFREMLAGLRLLLVDGAARRHLVDYLRLTEVREHVSPRQALADLLCLNLLRDARAGKFRDTVPFGVGAEIDEQRHRVVLRSTRDGAGDVQSSYDRLDALLRTAAVDFLWDHSEVARSVSFPMVGSWTLEFELPAGPHPLPAITWLARRRPGHVVAALAPIIGSET